ncbi:MAG: hypothetical protein QM741_02855 [Rudaea sp.]|uniref:hypothetical protein n=1 Tax=Rudaea sp. TaxID=2136325 RepID=UPI0039E3268D
MKFSPLRSAAKDGGFVILALKDERTGKPRCGQDGRLVISRSWVTAKMNRSAARNDRFVIFAFMGECINNLRFSLSS